MLIVSTIKSAGQSFTEIVSVKQDALSESIIMADLSQNDTLEVVTVGIDTLGRSLLKILSLNEKGDLELLKILTIPKVKAPQIWATNLDNDLGIDILLQGKVEGAPYFNVFFNDQMTFSGDPDQWPQLGSTMMVGDFTNDGLSDVIISDTTLEEHDSVALLLNKKSIFEVCDTCKLLPLKNSESISLDINNDGFLDFIMCGTTSLGNPKTYLYTNVHNTRYDTTTLPFDNINLRLLTKGDFDLDGLTDLVCVGTINDKDTILIYKNRGNDFEKFSGLNVYGEIKKVLPGDLTNDGRLDILVLTDSSLVLYKATNAGEFEATTIQDGTTKANVALGDFDRDNDLDIIVNGLIGDEIIFKLYKNENPENETPLNPAELFAFPNGDSVKLIWKEGSDDTTPIEALTYNLFVNGPNGDVYPVHTITHRSVEDYGLQNQSLETVAKNLPIGTYIWAVQSIDNSLAAVKVESGAGSGSNCWEFEISEVPPPIIYACDGQEINISIEPPTIIQWYSDSLGMLESTSILTYMVHSNDLVYGNYLNAKGCLQTYYTYVEVVSEETLELSNQEICYGDSLKFDISESFSDAIWKFQNQKDSIHGTKVTLFTNSTDTLKVEATFNRGCKVKKSIRVTVNDLPIIDSGEDITLFENESSQLHATGGDEYQWSPSTGLSASNIPNPIVKVNESTTYTVVASDTNMCYGEDEVVVFVKKSVFVPNLFSPNGDGHNDTFKVFGKGVSNVSLKIYDVKGKLLYESSNSTSAMQLGWDGTYKGTLMPQGDYLWIITGTFTNGDEISVNGKRTGRVTLIR